MIADESRSISALGNLEAGVLELRAFCREIVSFIERELPIWRQRPEVLLLQGEPSLNESLVLHLGIASHHKFDTIRFVPEKVQSPGRRADMGVLPTKTITVEGVAYQDYEQLMPVECKLLPTPPDSRRSDLEYVHGQPGHRTGGIERFKHGLHGPKNQHALMVGYVQAKSFKHWLDAINERLADLAKDGMDNGLWSPSELLNVEGSDQSERVQKLASRHQRLRPPCISDLVVMQHLWLLMN